MSVSGESRRRRRSRRLVPVAVAAVLVSVAVVGVAWAAGPSEIKSRPSTGAPVADIGRHFKQTGFTALEALPDGGLIAERNGRLESYSAAGSLQRPPPQPSGESRPGFPLKGGKRLVFGDEGRTVTRLNPDGSVDTGFGDSGTVNLELPLGPEAAFELPSGMVVLFRTDWSMHGGSPAAARVIVGTKSIVFVALEGLGQFASISEILPTPDGGALAVGEEGYMVALGPDGIPNPGFGSDGLLLTRTDLAGARVLADGSVAAVGSTRSWTEADLALLRYTAAGKPDPLFGRGGIRRFDLGGNEQVHVTSWATDGSVVVGGVSEAIGECQQRLECKETPVLAAFDPSGALDKGFAVGGRLRLAALTAGPGDRELNGVLAIARRPDGSVVAAGTASPKQTVAFMAALSPRGTLLPGFGDGGIVRLRLPEPSKVWVEALAAPPGGDVLLTGDLDAEGVKSQVVARYNGAGRLVRSFGDGRGFVKVPSEARGGFIVTPGGRVLFGSYGTLVEVNADDGSRVQGFGSNGVVELPEGVSVQSLGVDEDEGPVAVANLNLPGETEPGVVLRFDAEGRPDPRFGRRGMVRLRIGERAVKARAFGGFSRGRVLIGGLVRIHGGIRFALTRLLPNGVPDRSFGSGGWSTPFPGGDAKGPFFLSSVGPHIYLAGIVRRGEERPRIMLLRFNHDGRLDPSFGRGGLRLGPPPRSRILTAILPSPAGIVVALDSGPRPLLLFGRNHVRRLGKITEEPSVERIHAQGLGQRLVLGWATYPNGGRDWDYHLGSRFLP